MAMPIAVPIRRVVDGLAGFGQCHRRRCYNPRHFQQHEPARAQIGPFDQEPRGCDHGPVARRSTAGRLLRVVSLRVACTLLPASWVYTLEKASEHTTSTATLT